MIAKRKRIIKDHHLIAEFMLKGGSELYVPEYYNSWDWLMPVVERIEKMGPTGYEVCIIHEECEIGTMGYHYKMVARGTGLTKIEAVFNAIVSFIKWYNLNKHENIR